MKEAKKGPQSSVSLDAENKFKKELEELQKKAAVLFIRNVPADVKKKFKAECAQRGISMNDALISMMQEYPRHKTAMDYLDEAVGVDPEVFEKMKNFEKMVNRKNHDLP